MPIGPFQDPLLCISLATTEAGVIPLTGQHSRVRVFVWESVQVPRKGWKAGKGTKCVCS